MSIAFEILQQLSSLLAGAPVPRVRALHLPVEASLGHKDGEFCALELDDGAIGLSFVLLGDTLPRLRALAPAGQDPLRLAQGWLGDDLAERALGFAAVNALSRHVFDRQGAVPPPAGDSLAGLDPQPGERVGMVGLFPPLVRQVVASGAQLTVLELRPDLAGAQAGYRVTLDPAALAGCDKLLITSSTLLNGSLDRLLAGTPQARRVALIGPGAGCLPQVLFRHGVSALAGTWITDGPGLCAALRDGVPWGACTRKFLITRETFPAP